jgi:hypothetical protein
MTIDSGPIEIEALRAEVDGLVDVLAEARFRHVAGIDPAPALAAPFRARGRAAHRDTVTALRDAGEGELAGLVAGLRAERAQAADEEAWRAADSVAAALGPDGPLPLAEAQLAMTRERDRARRRLLGRAVAAASSSPARDAAAEKRARARAEVSLTPDWDGVVEADALLAASDDAYRDVLGWTARREAALAPPPQGDLERADLLFVLALHPWDGLFPPGMLALFVERTLEALRLDLRRLRIDDGDRPAKWPGAHAFEARVSLRRQGGAADWLALLDAVGQALAARHAPPHRRSTAAPFALGALLSGLLLDGAFLALRVGCDRKHAADLARALALRQLFALRARAAAFRVGTEVERGVSGAAWYELHRDAMTRAAGAAWPAGFAARDADGSRAGAALRGAARAERLRRMLVDRFDEDWWRNPRSADALAAVLTGGGDGDPTEPHLTLAAEPLVARLG